MTGRTLMVLSGIGLLLLGMFVGRPYCRFLCPYGALLRIGSAVSKHRVRVTPTTCTQCRLCESSCPFGALRHPESSITEPQFLSKDRIRLAWLLLLIPVFIVFGLAFGRHFSATAAGRHPTVRLAQRLVREQEAQPRQGPATAEDLELARARQQPNQIISEAAQIQQQFSLVGVGFGGWLVVVVGAKLISLCLRRNRNDYEPDAAACLACARCFAYCPVQVVRQPTLSSLNPQPHSQV